MFNCYFTLFFLLFFQYIQSKINVRIFLRYTFFIGTHFVAKCLNETHNSIVYVKVLFILSSRLLCPTLSLCVFFIQSSNLTSPSLSILSMTGMSKKNKLPEAIMNTLWKKFFSWSFCTNYVYKHQVFSEYFPLSLCIRRAKKTFHRYHHHLCMWICALQSYNHLRRRVVCRYDVLISKALKH